jgi:hypothetical protein
VTAGKCLRGVPCHEKMCVVEQEKEHLRLSRADLVPHLTSANYNPQPHILDSLVSAFLSCASFCLSCFYYYQGTNLDNDSSFNMHNIPRFTWRGRKIKPTLPYEWLPFACRCRHHRALSRRWTVYLLFPLLSSASSLDLILYTS